MVPVSKLGSSVLLGLENSKDSLMRGLGPQLPGVGDSSGSVSDRDEVYSRAGS